MRADRYFFKVRGSSLHRRMISVSFAPLPATRSIVATVSNSLLSLVLLHLSSQVYMLRILRRNYNHYFSSDNMAELTLRDDFEVRNLNMRLGGNVTGGIRVHGLQVT